MHTLKTFLARLTAVLWAVLQPLGAWGVFAIAGIDAAVLGMPLDAVVAGYVYVHPARFWLYTLVGAAGSALGSLVVYAIGYGMGELVLEKRIGKEKFERIRRKFEEHEFIALMVPAIMPPPFPFKVFALSAAVFEMHFSHYMLAIFSGRVVRFLILSALVIFFGPQVVQMVGPVLRAHLVWVLVFLDLALILGLALWLRLRRKQA